MKVMKFGGSSVATPERIRSVVERRLVVTDDGFGAARVDFDATGVRVAEHFVAGLPVQVVTGFIAATPEGETTTLGRGGSDYTASILGAALGAESVELWTDVDGVMSADPRIVPSAEPIAELSYDELMELSHFGAKVVHPPSVHPTRAAGIPLWIKNTLNPGFRGTRVLGSARAVGAIHDAFILGRLAGRDLDEGDVAVESLLPDESWYETDLAAFWERLAELDGVFAARQKAAHRDGKKLCYLAVLDEGGARVSLEAVGPEHPAASLRGTDNLIAVYTDRYDATPLVIRGPGAGPEVTAAGVFGDVLRAARES